MRILLRDRKTGEYVCGPGEWTSDIERAVNFGHAYLAMAEAEKLGREGFEIVCAFDDPAYNFFFPVEGRRDERKEK